MFSPLSQVSPIDQRGAVPNTSGHAAELARLRQQLDDLKAAFAASAQRATAQAVQGFETGAHAVSRDIRSAPLISIAIAAAAGIILGIAVTAPRSRRSDWQKTVDRVYAHVPDVDMSAVRRRLEDRAEHARDRAVGLLPTVEQLAQAVSRLEATTFTPMLEKGTTWVRGLWDSLGAVRAEPK